VSRVFSILVLGLGIGVGTTAVAAAPEHSFRPVARPQQMIAQRPDAIVLVTRSPGVQISLRPVPRPQFLTQISRAAPTNPTAPSPVQTAAVARGSICGIRSIKGEEIQRIRGKLRGCGIKSPVRVTSVSGVSLSQPATLNCSAAKALNTWVKKGVKPIVGRLGGGAASLQVVAHYSCRTRNNRPGAKISEHATGNAIDISAINLANGSSLRVLDGWKNRKQHKILKRLHRAACGPFGTVLGPNSDRFHQDHFHLDAAQYRSGSYCR